MCKAEVCRQSLTAGRVQARMGVGGYESRGRDERPTGGRSLALAYRAARVSNVTAGMLEKLAKR